MLVVGGAGYVGSHAVHWLLQAGHDVWSYDNLCTGHRQSVTNGQLIEGDLSDQARLETVLKEKTIDAVMHFAAFSLVGESVTNPAKYYENNVLGTFRLLEAMRQADVRKIVFSSTAAVYGEPAEVPIHEGVPRVPVNPYGQSKYIVEEMLRDYSEAYDFGCVALRYFNAAGAAPGGAIGEDHDPESHLIPLVLRVALGQRNDITVFGRDYSTADGTCVRDYVHVDDLAQAPEQALQLLDPGRSTFLNLGSQTGSSVLEVIEACRQVTGHAIPVTDGSRRAGDPPVLVADSTRASQLLNWKPRFTDIEEIVESAWKWHQAHPNGYGA